MSDSGDIPKYKWTPESTSLLVSIWSDRQVQKQLEYTSKPQLIWESVARYMRKKGYNVLAKHCRSRMKQVLVCYREAKRAGTRADVEQYYEAIDRVLKSKRFEQTNCNGIDTVDATANMKSPPKDVKTNKNLQVRHKSQEPVQSLLRTEALSPTWTINREFEYPDSPESNETIIARPNRVFSPTRDVAINTNAQLTNNITSHGMSTTIETPIREEYRQNIPSVYPYGEIPFQNSVQNVQNQIIQENMQQNQNLLQSQLWNQMHQQNMLSTNVGFQQNLPNINQGIRLPLTNDLVQSNAMPLYNVCHMNSIRKQQGQLYQNDASCNKAMPQEPQRVIYAQNMASNYRRHQDILPKSTTTDAKQNGSISPDYSTDITHNFNTAFCHSDTETKIHNLNETFNRSLQVDNQKLVNPEASVVTNNATYNDDSLLLDCLIESPIPSDGDNKSKDTAVNTEDMPNAPLRRKKAQKLEQLVLSAISSQNEVVNKILAAQNDMVSKFLDIDRDRQNRLENRLDHLLNVVHASVLNKDSAESETEGESEMHTALEEPAITSLDPPPKPGMVPPKLDLVPPKPCRVPCTIPSNIELINKNPTATRPGVVSPIMSPSKKPGTIWSKLGPVSQSPFVKAQQRLGLPPISNTETRTQSSAERRIAKEVGYMKLNTETLIAETTKFLEMEKRQEEKVRNAKLQQSTGHTLNSRRKLFSQNEPTAAMILTAAFLEAEREVAEPPSKWNDMKKSYKCSSSKRATEDEDLLAGQGESYERLRKLDQPATRSCYVPYEPCDTSTPAKAIVPSRNQDEVYNAVPKQTIQQLAQLVMNSGRWKSVSAQNQPHCTTQFIEEEKKQNACNNFNLTYTAPKTNAPVLNPPPVPSVENIRLNEQTNNLYKLSSQHNTAPQKPQFPTRFATGMLDKQLPKSEVYIPKEIEGIKKSTGFTDGITADRRQPQNVRFMDDALMELHRMYLEQNNNTEVEKIKNTPFMTSNGNIALAQNMIQRYIQEIGSNKEFGCIKEKEIDSDNDEEFLDTTGTMAPIVKRRGSSTSTGTTSTEAAHSTKTNKSIATNCVIS